MPTDPFPEDRHAHQSTGDPADSAADDVDFSDPEADRLFIEANQRVAGVAQASESFGKRLLQLIIVPGIIVGGIMLVWLVIVSMFGEAQGVRSLLTTLEDRPSGGGPVLQRPGYQERYRAAINLLGIVEAGEVQSEDREELLARLPALVRLYAEDDAQLSAFLTGTLGTLGDPASLPLFAELLKSSRDDRRYAAVLGLTRWVNAVRPLPLTAPAPPPPDQPEEVSRLSDLVPDLVAATTASDSRVRTLASLVIGSAAAPGDEAVLNALHRVLQDRAPENRTAAWNAAIVMAALGDERGVPVVISLLDRQWLATQPIEPERSMSDLLDEAAQDKVMLSVLESVIAFGPAGETIVRIESPAVWSAIEGLAENDPSDEVREAARAVTAVRAEAAQSGGG